ncbi:rieske [2Fe-2S] domain protein [mine drainage metagenome]|uniref:Rieske [2Fe-2S] domain protein n=1 Tax=mine drainage metagenome TaxID=410659 RepID=A0A1J5SWX3_9ZZZZ
MMQVENTVTINSEDLQNEAKGLRFALPALGEFATGFVVRFRGKPYAYVNQCAHVSIELDWDEGEFFTSQKDYLICATHGAHYQPDTGFCVMGPCKGKRLKSIEVTEHNQQVVINIASISSK